METGEGENPRKPSYPDSVLALAECIREATRSNSLVCNEGKSDSVRSDSLMLPSAITRKQHFCGSLFAKCAQQGRWPLVQTFTNRNSPLAQQTFSNRHTFPRSANSPERNLRIYQNIIKCRQPPKTILRLSDDRRFGISNEPKKRNKNKVTFAGSFSELKENDVETDNGLSDSDQKVFIQRRNSLPDRQVFDKNIFSDLNDLINKAALKGNADDRVTRFFRRGKSKSDDRATGRKEVFASETDKKINKNNFYTNLSPKKPKEKKINFDRIGNESKQRKTYNNGSHDDFKNEFKKNNGIHALKSDHQNYKFEETENEIDFFETEILLLRRELKKRDQENKKLQREIQKLKSVLQESSIFKREGDLLSSLQDSHWMPGQVQQIINIPNPNKKQGVSGESSNHGRNHDQIEIQRFDKDFRSKQLIKDAIMENDFLKNLDSIQVREIVESVYSKQFSRGDYVVREGEAGSHLFVSAEGEFEVIKDQNVLGRMGPGKAFGELAILYNCRRTASIKVLTDAKVWVLDRQVFQKIMMKTGLQRLQENLNFLRSVPLLQSLSNEVLAKIADALEVDFYPSGEHIIRQGASGDTFFIISSGSVKVTQENPGTKEEKQIRILNKGDYFGEQALLKEDWRTANIIALSPGVECLTLDRESFIQLIGDLSELQEKDYGDQVRGFTRPASSSSLIDNPEYEYIRLQDLDIVSTLGVGGFGRVELVQYSKNRSMVFALKCLKKQHIVETKQQEHVYSERNVMMACNSPFICRLYRTFRDSKYVYMLQEALLGGEVWTILREKGCFDDYTTKFIIGCVIEAFEYLHTRGIVYRDLKPENLLLDSTGYIKLVDFGFSKRIGFSSKTWTFCGTPEYLAPEIILNKGHDRAVDYWSLGVLMHELLTGIPPFTAPDPMRTYNIILKGIDMIDFPKHITKGAQSLIKRLCRDAPSERLGYQRGGIQDIKKHKWFQGFDWSGLKQKMLTPPFTPLVRSPTDTSNFDFYSKETSVPPDEFSNWDAEF